MYIYIYIYIYLFVCTACVQVCIMGSLLAVFCSCIEHANFSVHIRFVCLSVCLSEFFHVSELVKNMSCENLEHTDTLLHFFTLVSFTHDLSVCLSFSMSLNL